ncbi:hypothetical protein BJ742DRAFT_890540 [Cladochytrium replicatum]|nr:hypothetical protein BJ742DRAFT_890540 [Cladochytrium replicatum]
MTIPIVNSTEVEDPVIAQVSLDIRLRTSSFIDFSTVIKALLHLDISGESWTYNVQHLSITVTKELFLVAAIPRRDMFADIDSAQRTSILVTIIFAILMLAVFVVVIVAVTLPIRKLTTEMEKVAGFDFSLLRQGFFEENSVFSEIRDVQVAFNALVKTLAGAVSPRSRTREVSSSMF